MPTLAVYSSVQFIARWGRVSSARASQDSFGPSDFSSCSPLAEVFFGSESGQFLGYGHVDELI